MMGSRLLWAVVLGFLCGVALRSIFLIGVSSAYFALLLASVAIIFGLFDRDRVQSFLVVAVLFVFVAIGIARMDAAVITGDPVLTTHIHQYVRLTGVVVQEPDVRDTGVRLSVEANSLIEGSSTIAVVAGILVQLPPHTEVHFGDHICVSGTLDVPQPFDTGDGRQFQYPQYLAVSGIEYTLSFAQLQSVGTNSGTLLQSIVINLKERYLAGIDAVLPEPQAGLAAGITVGDKRSIGPALSADFQRVSLIQMVVLSGYNITVVANFISQLLSWAPRTFQFGSGIFVVVFFILVSGGASSAVRAGIMAALALYARRYRRTFDPLRALLVAAFVMVAWNPFTLMFDPGFQLSAIAMIGLSELTPWVARKFWWVTERFALREIIASSIATQCAVLPLLLYQSGQLSLLAVPANVAAMLPVPFAMLTSFIAAIGGILLGTAAVPIALPAYALLTYCIGVAHSLSSLPFASIQVGLFSMQSMLGAYALLLSALWYMRNKKERDGK